MQQQNSYVKTCYLTKISQKPRENKSAEVGVVRAWPFVKPPEAITDSVVYQSKVSQAESAG